MDIRELIIDYIYVLGSTEVYEIHTVNRKLAEARLLLGDVAPTQTTPQPTINDIAKSIKESAL